MSEPSERPKRRTRYAGRNPRHFTDKYKEHASEKYANDIAKILAAGKTPAGTHRPILVAELLQVLRPKPGDFVVDCTLGYGGHSQELLQAIQPGGRLLGLDTDPIELPRTEARLRAAGFGPDTFAAHHINYAGIAKVLPEPADIILADLGLSSMQIDNPARGFTFKFEGPLDLRMNPRRGRPASAFLAELSTEQLATALAENADETRAEEFAEAILKDIPATTTALAAVIRNAGGDDDAVRRVFQALRIAVNDEFSALDALLRQLPACLKPGGRVAMLTFHSGEDRRVKKALISGLREGTYEDIAREPLRPSSAEIRGNPRAKSAKLRWARKNHP